MGLTIGAAPEYAHRDKGKWRKGCEHIFQLSAAKFTPWCPEQRPGPHNFPKYGCASQLRPRETPDSPTLVWMLSQVLRSVALGH